MNCSLDDVRSGKGKSTSFCRKMSLFEDFSGSMEDNTNFLTFYGQLDPKALLECS